MPINDLCEDVTYRPIKHASVGCLTPSEPLRVAILEIVNAKAQLQLAQERLDTANTRYHEATVKFKQGVAKDAGCEWSDK
jgi:hypothetical protein